MRENSRISRLTTTLCSLLGPNWLSISMHFSRRLRDNYSKKIWSEVLPIVKLDKASLANQLSIISRNSRITNRPHACPRSSKELTSLKFQMMILTLEASNTWSGRRVITGLWDRTMSNYKTMKNIKSHKCANKTIFSQNSSLSNTMSHITKGTIQTLNSTKANWTSMVKDSLSRSLNSLNFIIP